MCFSIGFGRISDLEEFICPEYNQRTNRLLFIKISYKNYISIETENYVKVRKNLKSKI